MFSCTIRLPINKLKLCLRYLVCVEHLPIMACFKGEGKHIHSSTVQILYARILVRIAVLSFVTVIGLDDNIRRKICKLKRAFQYHMNKRKDMRSFLKRIWQPFQLLMRES